MLFVKLRWATLRLAARFMGIVAVRSLRNSQILRTSADTRCKSFFNIVEDTLDTGLGAFDFAALFACQRLPLLSYAFHTEFQ